MSKSEKKKKHKQKKKKYKVKKEAKGDSNGRIHRSDIKEDRGVEVKRNDSISNIASQATKNMNDSTERKLKRKRSECSGVGSNDDALSATSENDMDADDISLEGKMVPSSRDSGNMSLVLVHKQSGKVYSSGERTQDGRRLVIGKLVKGNVELDPLAVEQMKRIEEVTSSSLDATTTEGGPAFPYPTDQNDHCETPLQSYKDIFPILNELCKSFGGNSKTMNIYDPYYCDGSVIKRLSSLGFGNVYNKKEDCYAVWHSNKEPQFDVLLTNPPYSEDHIEKLMKYVTSPAFGNTPWLLLMPQWVHKKDYFVNATTKNRTRPLNVFYVVPKKRYVYLPPANFREKKESDTHEKSSPFISMWYVWGGNDKRNQELINAFQKSAVVGNCDLARSKSALRDLRRSASGKGRKKKKARP